MTIKSVILCGGQGTRIRDVADNIPKPMISIGERPVLWHIMKIYAHYGIDDFVLCLGYLGWEIKEFFINYRAFSSDITLELGQGGNIIFRPNALAEDWRVTLAETGSLAQTGARIWRVRHYLEDSELFCITYGDAVADIDLARLIRFHKEHKRIGTVTGVHPPGRFGVMRTTLSENRLVVNRFQEKPQTREGWINGGFFIFDHRLWNYLNDDPNLIFEREPLSRLAEDGQLVMYEHEGFWQPMDTYREWKILNELWSSNQAPWKTW